MNTTKLKVLTVITLVMLMTLCLIVGGALAGRGWSG